MLKLHGSWIILIQKMLLVINIGRKELIWPLGTDVSRLVVNYCFFLRIFDINSDGFVSKEEFGWMTTSKTIGAKEIEGAFKVKYFMCSFIDEPVSCFLGNVKEVGIIHIFD